MTALGQYFVGADDPGVSANPGDLWADTGHGEPFGLKLRDAAGTGWLELQLIARDGSGQIAAQVEATPTGYVNLKADSDAIQQALGPGGVNLDIGSAYLRLSDTNGAELYGDGVVLSLPDADPAVAGQLWNDTGTVKVSAG